MKERKKIQNAALTLALLATLTGCSLSKNQNNLERHERQYDNVYDSSLEEDNKEIEEDNLELEEEKSEEQDKIETDVPLIKDVQDNSTDEQIKVYENFNNDLPVQNNNIEENNVTNDNIIPDLKPEEVEEPIVNKEMPDWLKPVVKENENKVLEPTEEVNEEKPDKKDNDKVKPNKKPGGSLGGDTTRPEHTHEYIWKNFDSMIEKGICSCGKEETRLHTLSDWKYGTISDERECTTCDYIDIRNHIHNYTEWTIVNDTETRKCLTCGKEETREHTHEFSEWKFDGVNSDTRVCQTCKLEQTRDHIHTEVPEDLEYIYKSSNNDGTHTLEAKYTCEICGQEFSNIKTEECKFGKEEVENKGKNVLNEPYNEHYVTSSCEICDYENKVLKPCTPDSELKAIKLNGTIFEYYDCIECNGYVNRKEHTEHHIIYDDEYTTDTKHAGYCICVEHRDIGSHTYEFSKDPNSNIDIATCTKCGYSKNIPPHEHAKDEMDLLDLVMSPFYNDLLSFSPIANPNVSPYDYCNRLDFYCKICKAEYAIYYAHDFQNGNCTYGHCGHIADPNYTYSIDDYESTIEPSEDDKELITEEIIEEETETIIEDTPEENVDETLDLDNNEELIQTLYNYKDYLISSSYYVPEDLTDNTVKTLKLRY